LPSAFALMPTLRIHNGPPSTWVKAQVKPERKSGKRTREMGREMARESVGHGTPRLDYKNYVQLLGAAKLKSHQINKSATTIDLRMCKLDEILPIYINIYIYIPIPIQMDGKQDI